jgi:diadenosine tetraphosphatase ApaH/serine/threonine PP2A family protein phosphatase
MTILVISDIHANLTALEAVLADVGDYEAVWCLGDVVGYGPDPSECINRVRGLPGLVCLTGNHDAAVIGQIDINAFNAEARESIEWQRGAIDAEGMAFLRDLREKEVVGHVTLAHGSPRNPVWEYILDGRVARRNFDYFSTPYCIVGHTHVPFVFQLKDGNPGPVPKLLEASERLVLTPRALLNPGSVGQPRDRDPRAAYALFDPEKETWECRRVTYDIASVQERIQKAGLPFRHAQRLMEGW